MPCHTNQRSLRHSHRLDLRQREAFIEGAIDALWKLAARARTLLQLGDANIAQAATKTEDLLQRFSNVAIKAALVLKDNLEYMDRAEFCCHLLPGIHFQPQSLCEGRLK